MECNVEKKTTIYILLLRRTVRNPLPFLHIDERSVQKEVWSALVANHPAEFEILEWTPERDRDLVQRSFPEIDTQLFPRSCVAILAALQKLYCYGGIVVRGDDIPPNRGIRILLDDWKTIGPPKTLTVRGYLYPVYLDRSTIMASEPKDPVCKHYRDILAENMASRKWESPAFTSDVAIM